MGECRVRKVITGIQRKVRTGNSKTGIQRPVSKKIRRSRRRKEEKEEQKKEVEEEVQKNFFLEISL